MIHPTIKHYTVPLLLNVANNEEPTSVPSKGKEESRGTIHGDEIISSRQRDIGTALEMKDQCGDLHEFYPQ